MMMLALVLAIAALALAARRRWMIVTVRGHSMEPTLHDGERLIARRTRRARRGARAAMPAMPAIGELVVFLPDALGYRIKRVAGVVGDVVPPWIPERAGERIPAGHLIVRGDNPRAEGSRELGYIAVGSIIARYRGRRAGTAHRAAPRCAAP